MDHTPLKVDLSAERASLTTSNLPPLILTSANRVSLLYLLAQSIDSWVEDAIIGSGIWGRAWLRQDPNNLNVLLHRIRAQATKQGYDRRFIERKRGAMCLRIASAHSV